jgi:acetyltransferase-like isoleucine patch superfamily enzyme
MNERPLIEELGDDKLSPYKRYLNIFVGRNSFSSFLRYELLTAFLGPLPGAAGYFLRGKCYRFLLRKVGKGTVFGKDVVLRCPGRISLGQRVMIDDYAVLDAKGENSSLELGDQILLGRSTILSCNDSILTIGNFVSFGPFCFLASRSVLRIGSNVAIGAGTYFLGGGHAHDDPDTAVIHQARLSKGIIVEDNAWIGIDAKILDGVTIGRNSIVGAGAVVSKDVPPWTVVLGNPARVVEKRKQAPNT